MSTIATPPIQPISKATTPTPTNPPTATTTTTTTTASSAWSRGPPPAATPSSTQSPTIQTPSSSTPQVGATGSKPQANGNGTNGSAPVPIAGAGHSRKGSLMVGGNGGVDIKRGSIAFGTVDSPNPLLSSSPAAPSMTGTHLADTVKSFGSIEASTSDATSDAVKASRRLSVLGTSPTPSADTTATAKKSLNMHDLFAAKPSRPNGTPSTSSAMSPPPNSQSPMAQPMHDRRQSMGQNFPGGPNGLPNPPHPYQNQMMQGQQQHLRPPQNGPGLPRSPVMGQQIPQYGGQAPNMQQGFRPQQQGMMPQNPTQGGQVRPGGVGGGPQGMRGPMMGQQGMGVYGMHPSQQAPYPGMYPNQGYYQGGYNVYDPQQFSMPPQWAQQQHPQGQQQMNMPLSPRAGQSQLTPGGPPQPSPSPNLSGSGGASAAPTPPSRPPSLMNGHQPTSSSISSIPSTPSRPMMQTAPSFTPGGPVPQGMPQTPFSLSTGASSFTPRARTAIKITRADGTAVDLKDVAASVKPPTPSIPSSGVMTPSESGDGTAAKVVDESTKKKLPTLPVIVRMESEQQKKARLEEEAQRKRIRELEAKEEAERKERKERQAKEEEERKLKEKEEAEKAEKERAEKAEADAKAEEKRKMEEALAAEEAAAKKAQEERDAAAKAAKDAEAEKEAAAAHAAAEAARAEATEKEHALLTPNPQSVSPSPLASPALAAAGLPPKPVITPSTSAAAAARRPVPSALEIKPESPAMSEGSPAAVSTALSTARPIDDLKSITYPGALKSPKPELNVDAQPGKFRYDRDFLMQFMNVCREKPEGLPPLEEIGLEADSSSGFGTSRSQSGRGRSSMGPPGRSGAATGLGIGGLGGGGRPAFPGQGMGSFGMGQFGSGNIRGTTSEERYNRSLAQGGRLGSMARTPSQGGPGGLPPMHGLPAMGQSTSRGGVNRSQRGQKRQPAAFQVDPDVAPLQITQNAWVKARGAPDDENSPAYIEKKVKGLLNKLTAEKFDSISKQILDWGNKSMNETDGMTLKLVIKQVFEKATDEAHWSAMYARLCRLLLDQLNEKVTEVIDGKEVSGGILFRKYLVGRCQVDFESGWKAREDAATAAAAKSEEDKEALAKQEKEEGGGEAAMLSDEYYAAQKAKRRGLGLVQLIGELYKLDMITKGVIKTCFVRLLGNVETPDEEDIESTCKLLVTVGQQFDKVSPENMDIIMEKLGQIAAAGATASRIKFMIMDVIDLRKAHWPSKNKGGSVMTIAEVHQQAAREQAEKAQAQRESISRGGSRAGHARRDGAGAGEWQSVGTPGPTRTIQRPTDFSNIGRNISSAGLPSAPTFGSSSVFKGRKAGGAGVAGGPSPSLSRQASTTNMFSVLEGTENPAAAAPAAAEAPKRVKLNLAPRTKPLPGEGEEGADGEGDGEEEEEDEEEAEEEEDVKAEEPKAMSADAARTKIATDLKELWGEKDQGGSRNPEDVAEYFKALPEEHRHLLATKLVDDVFRIGGKIDNAKVVGKGWELALEQGSATSEVLSKAIESRMPALDDDSIDFPQAYKAIAVLMRSISSTPEEIAALLDKVDLMGLSPKVTPTDKLNRAFAQLDEEPKKA